MVDVQVTSEQRQQIQQIAANFASGVASPAEQRASMLISSGVLRGQEFARALLLLIVNKAEKEKRGLVRTGSSKLPECSQEVLMEVGFRLGWLVGNRELMHELGLNAKGLPPINFWDESLPVPFSADLGSSQRLITNLETCMTLCRAEFKRVLGCNVCACDLAIHPFGNVYQGGVPNV